MCEELAHLRGQRSARGRVEGLERGGVDAFHALLERDRESRFGAGAVEKCVECVDESDHAVVCLRSILGCARGALVVSNTATRSEKRALALRRSGG